MKNQKEMLSINKRVFMYNLYIAACLDIAYRVTYVRMYYLLLHNTYIYIYVLIGRQVTKSLTQRSSQFKLGWMVKTLQIFWKKIQ